MQRKANVILAGVLAIACLAHFSRPGIQPPQWSYEILTAVTEDLWNTISASPAEPLLFLATCNFSNSCIATKLIRNVLGPVRGGACASWPGAQWWGEQQQVYCNSDPSDSLYHSPRLIINESFSNRHFCLPLKILTRCFGSTGNRNYRRSFGNR